MWKDPKKAKKWHKERYRKKKAYIEKLKEAPCTDCKKTYPHYVMEFDHVPERGKKKYCLYAGAGTNINSPIFIKELNKCDIVCSNCHAIRTYKRHIAKI